MISWKNSPDHFGLLKAHALMKTGELQKIDIIRQLVILLCYLWGIIEQGVVVKKDKTFNKFVVGIHTGYNMELKELH